MANTVARIGSAVLVQYADNFAFTTNKTTLGEVIGVKIPKVGTEAVEATTVSSANFIKERVYGLVDFGEATLRIQYGPETAGHTAVALWAKTRVKKFWRFTLPTAAGAVTDPDTTRQWGPFEAIVTGFEVNEITPGGLIQATITLQYTGDSNGFTIPA